MEITALPHSVKKYLDKYASSKWKLEYNTDDVSPVNNAVVIPAIKEYDNIKTLMNSLLRIDGKYFPESLFIFVINNSENADEEIRNDNALSVKLLRSIIGINSEEVGLLRSQSLTRNDHYSGEKKDQHCHCERSPQECLPRQVGEAIPTQSLSLTPDIENDLAIINAVKASGLRIALVDASSTGMELPEKDAGVGLARKTGMDLALTVFDYTNTKKKTIINLDADCTVKENYLTEIVESFNNKNISAAAINYEHDIYNAGNEPGTAEENLSAIISYEIFLRYYVLGLKFAGSHYAFHTIGSSIGADYESYIKAEGMNKRKAAEDFYYMQKIAKNTDVSSITTTTVYPSSRSSWRVPFGTGQRITRFLSGTRDEFVLYDPKIFIILKEWLNVFHSEEILSSEEYIEKAKNINTELAAFLEKQSFVNDWNKIVKNSKTNKQANRQKTSWFDGFRTLKLIHHLRDTVLPEINMFDALDEFFIMLNVPKDFGRKEKLPELEIQREYLVFIREIKDTGIFNS